MSRSRSYVFTINNWTDDDKAKCEQVECKYICYGFEVGASGTPHIQGMVCFDHAKTIKVVSKIFPRAHLEVAKGTPDQAAKYCQKDGDYKERGERPKSSAQKGEMEIERWDFIKKSAQEGNLEAIPSDVYVKHYNVLKRIKKDHMKMPDDLDNVSGMWIYGLADAGKSRYVREHYRIPGQFYDKPLNQCTQWWDGYQGEKYVLIEDIDPDHAKFRTQFKRWADRYAFPVENKGGAEYIRPELIIFTSQYRIEDIWYDRETIAAMKRRMLKVIHMVNLVPIEE